MPFVNGKYVPEDSSAAEQKNLKKQQEKLEKEQKRAQKEQLQEKKRKQKAEKNKNNKPELTPEQIEELEREKQRQIEESARRFEELISTDNPDLTNLNKLIESEKKKADNPIRKNSKGVAFVLTVILLSCLGFMFAAISFASGELLVISLALIAVFSVFYYILVPRRK